MAQWKEREADRYSHDKWYENIWFHYKTHILMGLLLVAVVLVLIFSSGSNDKTDMYILYITETPIVYEEKSTLLKQTLCEYAQDVNGDGELNITLENLYIGEEFDSVNVYKNKEKIMTALRTGSCMFIVADEVGAMYLTEGESCADIRDKVPAEEADHLAFDGRLWDWTGTEFKESNEMFGMIFEDSPLYFGIRIYENTIAELTEDSKMNFAAAESLLKAIVTNTKPE